MSLVVHKPVVLPLSKLRQLDDNPKKDIGQKQLRGLRSSLKEFGFAGICNVALDQDGIYTILDGNTRTEELEANGITEVPCYIHDSMAWNAPNSITKRREFVLSFDRNRKIYDERRVMEELQTLVASGLDVKKLSDLTCMDKLKRICEEGKHGNAKTTETETKEALEAASQKLPEMASLMLYGPTTEIDRIRTLIKSVKGRFSATKKVVITLEQAAANLEMDDDTFLACFLAALAKFQDITLGGMDEEIEALTIPEEAEA